MRHPLALVVCASCFFVFKSLHLCNPRLILALLPPKQRLIVHAQLTELLICRLFDDEASIPNSFGQLVVRVEGVSRANIWYAMATWQEKVRRAAAAGARRLGTTCAHSRRIL